MNTQSFASLLKQKRTTLGYSQSKVAELCYLSKSSYNHLEHGKRYPSLDTLIRLSGILHTNPNEFISAIISDENNFGISNQNAYLREDQPKESEYKNSLIESFDLLSTNEQKAILDVIDSILSLNEDKIK